LQNWQKDSDKGAWPSCQPRIVRPFTRLEGDVAALLKKAGQKRK
jgi:hypothetical protein